MVFKETTGMVFKETTKPTRTTKLPHPRDVGVSPAKNQGRGTTPFTSPVSRGTETPAMP